MQKIQKYGSKTLGFNRKHLKNQASVYGNQL